MTVPRATMRLQFHKGFTFADATPLTGYFAALGISHLYASPITTARPGSMHGYDTIDASRINPELGGEEQLRRLVQELRQHEMGLIVDIVPNHMAVGPGNAWWMDVLAHGRNSRYAKFFDIDWDVDDPRLRGKVFLPILGRPYGEALAAGELTVHRGSATPTLHYFDHVFPLATESIDAVKKSESAAFDPASAAGRQHLHGLLEAQHYRLAWWRSANDEINWRRFFDINELAAMRVEDDDVFEAVHATIFRLYAQGWIDGVRVDHIDGLSQPESYCRKLRERLHALEPERPAGCPRGPAYFVVEKILAHDERLPKAWETDGTTGYDFMDEVDALQHDGSAEQPLTALWERVSGRPGDFDAEEVPARRQILDRSFSAQREGAVRALYEIAQSDLATRDIALAAIRRVLTEILVNFPVYRIYAGVGRASPPDRAFLTRALERAKESCTPADRWLVELLGQWLSGERIRPQDDQRQAIALARFQQLSAPLCAKAVEDTAFYRYGRLISRNDVGFDVRHLACAPSEFHQRMQARARDWPHAMLATATHDHKRGEDVRARLAVLSERAAEWAEAAEGWIERSACDFGGAGGATLAPGDLFILFQTLVGAWPLGLDSKDKAGLGLYEKRIAAWQQKALREAKLHSDWSAPNEAYEQAARDYLAGLCSGPSDVVQQIADFVQRIAPAGAANGLAQLVMKLTAPGVPDIYQGTEFWDFSLVDPDNRSAVGFAARQKSLDTISPDEIAQNWQDGRVKQFVLARILALRNEMPELFADGDYVPLQTIGSLSDHVVAFARVWRNLRVITAFCRLPGQILAGDGSLGIPDWKDTQIRIPSELQASFSNILMPKTVVSGSEIAAAQLLNRLPVAVLTNHSSR
jgi:malto-oligosyltrehalose synthase